MIAGSVAISAARLAGHSTYFLASLLDTPPPPRLIDPTRWETSGPVLLMNLDHASDWQTPRCRESFQLLLDDRWDIFDDLYPNYANVCRDIGNIRAISYLRSDGQWGGYIRWTNEWKPTLLVVDSRDRDVLRRLSLSPDWRVVGIDAKRTIYAWDDAPQNKRQLAYATNTFLRLEWPRPLPDDWDSRLLVAHEPREWRRVASVLSAMRLPYAALRTLPLDWEWETEKERAWAYTELAHRTHRHAAETSLLDQFRAVARLRRGLEESRFSGKEKVRIARGLAALDLAELAHEFEPFANAPPESKPSPDATPEQHLRHALARADAARFPQLLPQLSSSVRRFYEVLTSANHKTARELFIDLTTVLAAPQLPDRLRGEAWFYQGCLAIEAGDSQAATHAFTESQRTDPTSPFGSLRKFHLAQLAAR